MASFSMSFHSKWVFGSHLHYKMRAESLRDSALFLDAFPASEAIGDFAKINGAFQVQRDNLSLAMAVCDITVDDLFVRRSSHRSRTRLPQFSYSSAAAALVVFLISLFLMLFSLSSSVQATQMVNLFEISTAADGASDWVAMDRCHQ